MAKRPRRLSVDVTKCKIRKVIADEGQTYTQFIESFWNSEIDAESNATADSDGIIF